MANKKVTYDEVASAYAAQNKAVDEKVKADSAAYAAQREDIGDASMSTLQQLYIQNERNKLTKGQAARASGLTGGALESVAIADRANYMNARTDALINRDKQVAQVDIAENQAKAQAEIDKQANNTQMEVGRLSFQQDQDSSLQSGAWEFIRQGIYTDEIGKILPGYSPEALKLLAQRYKEASK